MSWWLNQGGLWTFVGQKRQARWLWIALERSTRQVLAWRRGGPSRRVVGDLGQETAFKCWNRGFWQVN